jgi:hypothetical protein
VTRARAPRHSTLARRGPGDCGNPFETGAMAEVRAKHRQKLWSALDRAIIPGSVSSYR